jgi:hypothetical protein
MSSQHRCGKVSPFLRFRMEPSSTLRQDFTITALQSTKCFLLDLLLPRVDPDHPVSALALGIPSLLDVNIHFFKPGLTLPHAWNQSPANPLRVSCISRQFRMQRLFFQ